VSIYETGARLQNRYSGYSVNVCAHTYNSLCVHREKLSRTAQAHICEKFQARTPSPFCFLPFPFDPPFPSPPFPYPPSVSFCIHQTGAKVSRQFSTTAEVSRGHFGTVALNCLNLQQTFLVQQTIHIIIRGPLVLQLYTRTHSRGLATIITYNNTIRNYASTAQPSILHGTVLKCRPYPGIAPGG